MNRRLMDFAPVALATISLLAFAPALAEDVKLPPTMTFTAYDTGTAGFNIAVAVGKMMKDKYGTDVRVLPAGNDVARLAPLRAGARDVFGDGLGHLFRAGRRVRVRRQGMGTAAAAAACCRRSTATPARSASPSDTGVKEIKDLKGKRVGFVVGSPALNQNALAILAFGGLKQSDVKIVEFSSYGAMWKGMINNDVDAAFAHHHHRPGQGSRDLAARPGLAAAAAQRQGRMGAASRKSARSSSRITPPAAPASRQDKPIELGNYPYPIFVAYGSQPADQIYADRPRR